MLDSDSVVVLVHVHRLLASMVVTMAFLSFADSSKVETCVEIRTYS